MVTEKVQVEDEAFIAYLDEKNEQIEGWFKILEIDGWKVRFSSGKSVITLPLSRILKIRERVVK